MISVMNDIGAEFRSQFVDFRSRRILQNFMSQAVKSGFSDRWGASADEWRASRVLANAATGKLRD